MPSSFDVNWFNNAPVKFREGQLAIPDELKPALRKEGDATWTVRQLEDSDIVRAEEENEKMGLVPKIVEAASGSSSRANLDAIKTMLGISDDTPSGTRKKISYLSAASVDPEIDRQAAGKLLRNFPIFGNQLVNEIMRLTGLGAELGKQKASIETQK